MPGGSGCREQVCRCEPVERQKCSSTLTRRKLSLDNGNALSIKPSFNNFSKFAHIFNKNLKSQFPLKAIIFNYESLKDYSCELSTFAAENFNELDTTTTGSSGGVVVALLLLLVVVLLLLLNGARNVLVRSVKIRVCWDRITCRLVLEKLFTMYTMSYPRRLQSHFSLF